VQSRKPLSGWSMDILVPSSPAPTLPNDSNQDSAPWYPGHELQSPLKGHEGPEVTGSKDTHISRVCSPLPRLNLVLSEIAAGPAGEEKSSAICRDQCAHAAQEEAITAMGMGYFFTGLRLTHSRQKKTFALFAEMQSSARLCSCRVLHVMLET
jgi:hypothetical protein